MFGGVIPKVLEGGNNLTAQKGSMAKGNNGCGLLSDMLCKMYMMPDSVWEIFSVEL